MIHRGMKHISHCRTENLTLTKALQTNCLTLDHNLVIQAIFLSLSILLGFFLGSQRLLGYMELTINRLEIYECLKGQIFSNTGLSQLS